MYRYGDTKNGSSWHADRVHRYKFTVHVGQSLWDPQTCHLRILAAMILGYLYLPVIILDYFLYLPVIILVFYFFTSHCVIYFCMLMLLTHWRRCFHMTCRVIHSSTRFNIDNEMTKVIFCLDLSYIGYLCSLTHYLFTLI